VRRTSLFCSLTAFIIALPAAVGASATSSVHPTRIAVSTAASPEISVLVGQEVLCAADPVAGSPVALEWRVTEPGGTPPVEPTQTGASLSLQPTIEGAWTVELTARYQHEQAPGVAYTTQATATINASSVVAVLSISDSQFITEQAVVLDGSDSYWAAGLTPAISWTLTGPTPYDCGDQLVCTIPGNSLDPGNYTAQLRLENPGSGWSDTAGVAFTMIELPELVVDFTYTPDNPDPGVLVGFTSVLPSYPYSFTGKLWDFDDGETNDTCASIFNNCADFLAHRFDVAGYYDVTLTVTASNGVSSSITKEIKVGDPPRALFTMNPAQPALMQQTSFTFTGECDTSCSYSWSFGDGTTSSVMSPIHIFPFHGSFPVTLTVTNDSGSDSTSTTVAIDDCWTPPPPNQLGSCYGGVVQLAATDAHTAGLVWSTGASTRTTTVTAAGSYWLSAESSADCWGTVDVDVALSNCGSSIGDVNLDSAVDAADIAALLSELSDGDGTAVTAAGGGERRAPGGDITLDNIIDIEDYLALLGLLFSSP